MGRSWISKEPVKPNENANVVPPGTQPASLAPAPANATPAVGAVVASESPSSAPAPVSSTASAGVTNVNGKEPERAAVERDVEAGGGASSPKLEAAPMVPSSPPQPVALATQAQEERRVSEPSAKPQVLPQTVVPAQALADSKRTDTSGGDSKGVTSQPSVRPNRVAVNPYAANPYLGLEPAQREHPLPDLEPFRNLAPDRLLKYEKITNLQWILWVDELRGR